MAENPDTLTDLERAARFLYLQRTAFGGKVAARHFGVSPGTPGRFDITRIGTILEEVHARLAGVVIECLPNDRLIPRYDRPGTLFYLDPPYWGSEDDYGRALFGREDFDRLAGLLAGIKGRFLMSLNDHPAVRQVFGRFAIQRVETTYSIAGGAKAGRGKVAELLIANVPFRVPSKGS